MTAIRDDMTLAEAQAEAERRWPGAVLKPTAKAAVTIVIGTAKKNLLVCVLYLPTIGEMYFAYTPVGCLDQAIAAEARRDHSSYFRPPHDEMCSCTLCTEARK